MKRTIELFRRAKIKLDRATDALLMTLLAFLLATVTVQVAARYVFRSPIPWTEELARYLFIWLVFIGTAAAFRQGKHLKIESVSHWRSSAAKAIARGSVHLLVTGFLLTMILSSPNILRITFGQTSPTLSLPMGFVYLSFVVSLSLMLIEELFQSFMKLAGEPR